MGRVAGISLGYGLPFAAVSLEAIVLLGCRIARDGRPRAAALRRAARAAHAWHEKVAPVIVVSGGRLWHGVSEADALTETLCELGVERSSIILESRSLSTLENARYSLRLLRARGVAKVGVVTCDWHIPRALRCFEALGVHVVPLAAISPQTNRLTRGYRALREQMNWLLTRLILSCLVVSTSCHGQAKGGAAGSARKASSSAAASANDASRRTQLTYSEQRRNSRNVTSEDLSSRDVVVRRRAARALARIADDRAAELLAKSLADEDSEVITWSAYGIGYTCKGREPAATRLLVTRAVSLVSSSAPAQRRAPRGAAQLDVEEAIADALARCGGGEAERTLRAWLLGPDRRSVSAALALGRLASHQKRLDDSSLVALLELASRAKDPVYSALFAFSRVGELSEAMQSRLREVAHRALQANAPERAFVVRALGHAGASAAGDLATILTDERFSPSERADAARELGRLGDAGQSALLSALPKLLSAKGLPDRLASAAFGPLITTLEALGQSLGQRREALEQLAQYPIPARASGALRRRIVALRCRAAALFAGTASLNPALVGCDPTPGGRAGLLALLQVLNRGPISGPRYTRWLALLNSPDIIVQQAALGLMPAHPEILAPHAVLARSLLSDDEGIVTTAAQVLAAYPDRASEAKAARGSAKPRAADRAPEPAPSSPAVKPHPSVVDALDKAWGKKRAADSLETHVALLDATAALQLLSFKTRMQADCANANPTLREHAEKALRLLGENRRKCDRFDPPSGPVAPPASSAGDFDLRFTTDLGELRLMLDSELAPLATLRVVELARAGFYNGMRIHRVVPGFVVQFGDSNGDGFGGSGKAPLPCETSPLRFDALRVGMALSGRDTASSQIFVTLGPFPHLDGNYALIGRAMPGWDAVYEGDVIHKVRVTP